MAQKNKKKQLQKSCSCFFLSKLLALNRFGVVEIFNRDFYFVF